MAEIVPFFQLPVVIGVITGSVVAIGTVAGVFFSRLGEIHLANEVFPWQLPKQDRHRKRGVDVHGVNDTRAIFFFPGANLTHMEMDVINNMVLEPIKENLKEGTGNVAIKSSKDAKIKAYGYITNFGTDENLQPYYREGILLGNLSITLWDHPMTPVQGHWLYVQGNIADEKTVADYHELEKAVDGVNEHKAVVYDLLRSLRKGDCISGGVSEPCIES